MHVHYKKNLEGRDLFVGDIHGRIPDFLELLANKYEFNPIVDRVFSVGDLVDRGPSSDCVDKLLAYQWFYPVRGNHEQIAIQYLNKEFTDSMYSQNGGDWFIALSSEKQQDLVALFKKMPYTLSVDTTSGLVGVIHAEASNDFDKIVERLAGPNKDDYSSEAIWSRTRINQSHIDFTDVTGVDYVVVGHTVVKEITRVNNVLYIDTGYVFEKSGYGTLVVGTIEEILAKAKAKAKVRQ